MQKIVIDMFAKRKLRSLAFAYKDFTHEVWRDLTSGGFTNQTRIEDALLSDLTLISIFGMQDELRPNVREAIKLANQGSIKVCLVSGDKLETAAAFAIDSGLLSEEYLTGSSKRAIIAEDLRQYKNLL